jgi:transcriptional regulator
MRPGCGGNSNLVDSHEGPLPEPWHIGDAPPDYIEKMLAAIVGIEIVITDLTGKWKVSQNQPGVNRAGVVAGLRGQGNDNSRAIADLVAGVPSR